MPNDKSDLKNKIIIEGVTESGSKFRPSDWAERISGTLSTFRNRRVYYSPLLQPLYRSGNKCVALDPSLKETNPELYQSILNFAKSNNLKICSEEDEEEK
jgi:hypothetical protein